MPSDPDATPPRDEESSGGVLVVPSEPAGPEPEPSASTEAVTQADTDADPQPTTGAVTEVAPTAPPRPSAASRYRALLALSATRVGKDPDGDRPGGLDRSGPAQDPSSVETLDDDPGPAWWRGALYGLVTALLSAALVIGPTWLAWRGGTPTLGTSPDALRTGASLWLLASGAQLTAGEATVALTPLLGLALMVLLARLGARESMVDVATDGDYWGGLLPRELAATVGSWLGGYLAGAGAVAAFAAGGAMPPVLWSLALPLLLVPGLGMALAVRSVWRLDPEVLGPRLEPDRLPRPLRQGFGAGLYGVGSLLLLGTVVVLAAVALGWSRVVAIQSGLGTDSVGTLIVGSAQLAVLPNLALWAVSFLAGPGFQVVGGASITWSGAQSGLLPMVPVLGALPQPQPFPVWVPAVGAAVLLVIGHRVGRRSLRGVARLARLRTKLAVALAACATTALVVALLDAVGGGSLGQFRLASVGAPALVLGLSVFGWLAVGAIVAVLRDVRRLRR